MDCEIVLIEKPFIVFEVCYMSGLYRFAEANVNSAAAMASRKVNSWEIQSMLKTMQALYVQGQIDFLNQLKNKNQCCENAKTSKC